MPVLKYIWHKQEYYNNTTKPPSYSIRSSKQTIKRLFIVPAPNWSPKVIYFKIKIKNNHAAEIP